MIPLTYNVRSLAVRWASTAMAAMGVALVVMILFILFGFVDGITHTTRAEANASNWIILSRGSIYEGTSAITQQQYDQLRAAPEIATDSAGAPLISPELIDGLNVAPGHRNTMVVYLRGIKPMAFKVHRQMKLESGRWPGPTSGEWAIGHKLAAKYPQLGLGQSFHFGRRNWTVAGIFSDGDSARESEVWANTDDLIADYRGPIQAIANVLHVVVKPGESDALLRRLHNDSRLSLDAMSEADFYAEQNQLARQIETYGIFVALILAIGAVFGGMNTMYSSVLRRRREIGVLRAVGFHRRTVLASFIFESALLGVVGAIVGEMLGILVAATTGLTGKLMSAGLLIFSFRIGTPALVAGLIGGFLIGVVGGALPAWRAAAVGVNESLREA